MKSCYVLYWTDTWEYCRILNDANMGHDYDGLLWTLRYMWLLLIGVDGTQVSKLEFNVGFFFLIHVKLLLVEIRVC